jgi:hypothetical protein
MRSRALSAALLVNALGPQAPQRLGIILLQA